jgi:hypothetical protein
MEKRITKLGKGYWDNNGAYQKEYDELYTQLVPAKDEAETVHGEMIRCVSRLFYDYCNNGNCNVLDGGSETYYETCDNCGGSGYTDDEEEDQCNYCYGDGEVEVEDDGELYITEYYSEMFDFLEDNMLNPKFLIDLKEYLLNGDGDFNFGPEEMKRYNNLTDEVMYQVLTTENKLIEK